MKYMYCCWSRKTQVKYQRNFIHIVIICVFTLYFTNVVQAQALEPKLEQPDALLQIKYALMRTQTKNAELKEEFKY